MLFWYGPMYCLAFPLAAYLFLPVFYKLKLTSLYEYLELRFNFACRFLASITFCIQMFLYMSVALYAPALALSSVTSTPLFTSIVATAGLAALYVTLGGAKASIYTSALQMALILISMIVIVAMSLFRVGISDVIKTTVKGARLQLLDFRIDPRIRHSVWSVVIGGTGNILCLFATNQLTVQRYMAMGSLKSAQSVALLNIPFNALVLTAYVGVGLIMFNAYYQCDPVLEARDRLFPHFILERLSGIPGIVGLFVAAVCSAGLSTLSASYSALAAVFIEDVIKQYCRVWRNEQIRISTALLLARILPVVFCCASIGFAYVCSLLDTMLLQISLSIFGVAGGPVLSIFCLGLFFPRIGGVAAFIGQMTSTILCFIIAAGALLNHVRPVGLPLHKVCDALNESIYTYSPLYGMVHPLNSESWIVEIFRISYQYYSVIAVIISLAVANFVQHVFVRGRNQPVRKQLLSPHVCCRKPDEQKASELAKSLNGSKENDLNRKDVEELFLN